MSNLYTIAKGYADAIREECATLDDATERAWEYADGASEVIYTAQAWDLVSDNRGECEDVLQDMGMDVSATFDERGIDGVITLMAFAGLYRAICECLTDAEWDEEDEDA